MASMRTVCVVPSFSTTSATHSGTVALPLVLCLREAPLNLIHLRNMVAVTEAGATVYPMIPTYYNVPESLAQLRDEFVERVMQFLGLPGTDRYQWDGSDTAARREHTQVR
ncbi:flavoprotein [Streptomyces sp. NBC_01361]|uniref:flavoprotein n=1 Tax=Streptomyces sp. NBC_01361 TaxID=2903838 RepID=UPI002E3769D7|nr:flavoprotein [Streptomyces sp. NBC_01361]